MNDPVTSQAARREAQIIPFSPSQGGKLLACDHWIGDLVPSGLLQLGILSLLSAFVTVLIGNEVPEMVVMILVLGGIGLFVICSVLSLLLVSVWRLSLRALARRQFAARPDRLVNPTDAAAVLVRIVRREKLRRLRWYAQRTADIGYLFADIERRELLFEGDQGRYRIPEEAVISCDNEKGRSPLSVLLRFRDAEEKWRELRLVPHHGLLERRRKREARAERLLQCIWSICLIESEP
jgi:hypothetical protein